MHRKLQIGKIAIVAVHAPNWSRIVFTLTDEDVVGRGAGVGKWYLEHVYQLTLRSHHWRFYYEICYYCTTYVQGWILRSDAHFFSIWVHLLAYIRWYLTASRTQIPVFNFTGWGTPIAVSVVAVIAFHCKSPPIPAFLHTSYAHQIKTSSAYTATALWRTVETVIGTGKT